MTGVRHLSGNLKASDYQLRRPAAPEIIGASRLGTVSP
jgi:hypothetical protein